MMAVHNQKKEREEMEIERFSINDENNFSTSSSNNQKRKDRNRSSKAQTCKSSPGTLQQFYFNVYVFFLKFWL